MASRLATDKLGKPSSEHETAVILSDLYYMRREKKVKNCLAMLHLARAWITFRAAGLFR